MTSKITILFSIFFFSAILNQIYMAQTLNKFDANNKRTGVWKKYYANKRLRYTGQFVNGKEVGAFKFYSASSFKHPVAIKTYSTTSDSVKVAFYSTSGVLKSKGIIVNRNRVGKWFYYNSLGQLVAEDTYAANGKKEGLQKVFYPNGKLTEIAFYKNGVLHGITKKYADNGILIEEISYKNNLPNGLAKYYELNGKLRETGVYKNGKRVGEWQFFLDGEAVVKKSAKKTFKRKNTN